MKVFKRYLQVVAVQRKWNCVYFSSLFSANEVGVKRKGECGRRKKVENEKRKEMKREKKARWKFHNCKAPSPCPEWMDFFFSRPDHSLSHLSSSSAELLALCRIISTDDIDNKFLIFLIPLCCKIPVFLARSYLIGAKTVISERWITILKMCKKD